MPSAKIRFLFLSDLSLLFKLLHEKVYHPLAVSHTQPAAGTQPVKLQPITTSRNNCCSCYHKNPVQLLGWVAQAQPLQQITQAKEKFTFEATDKETIEGWEMPPKHLWGIIFIMWRFTCNTVKEITVYKWPYIFKIFLTNTYWRLSHMHTTIVSWV